MPSLTYLGHSAVLVEGKDTAIIIDPFLSGNPMAKIGPEEIAVQYVLLTHGHGDHVGDAIAIARRNEATIIAPFELAGWCEQQGARTHPMHIGGAFQFPFGRVKLTIAHHGSSTPDGTYAGQPSGVLLTLDGKTLYHAGDTALFYDMKLIGELNDIAVALLPIGDNFTMGIDDAVIAAEFIKAGFYIPMHFNTFPVIEVNPQAFVSKLAARSLSGKVLPVGESHRY